MHDVWGDVVTSGEQPWEYSCELSKREPILLTSADTVIAVNKAFHSVLDQYSGDELMAS